MTAVEDLTEGDVVDLQELPIEIDLDKYPEVEFELAVVEGTEDDWVPGSDKVVLHTNQGSWAVKRGVQVQVRSKVRR